MSSPRTTLILGANGGIGRAVVARLTARGDRLLLAGRDVAAIQEIADEHDQVALPLESLDFASMEDLVKGAIDEYGNLHGVVHAVGSMMLKPAHLTSEPDYDELFDLHVKSAFALTRALGKAARKADTSVVFFTSAAARIGLAHHEAIGAAKGALVGLARSASATYARQGLRFNCVAPGLIETPMTQKITENERARDASISLHPLGRLGQPSEVASLVDWLTSADATWVTAQEIGVDGGLASLKVR